MNKPSLRKSINLKCRDCIYDPQAVGTWRKQVSLCPATDCPLHAVRPGTYALPKSAMSEDDTEEAA